MKRYFPILLSKAGELKALKMITEDVRKRVVPIIQVLDLQLDSINATFTSDLGFYDELFLDFSLTINTGKDQIKNLILELVRCNIKVTPVIQGNNVNEYDIKLIKELLEQGDISGICVRFSGYNDGFFKVYDQLSILENRLGAAPNKTSVIFDFGCTDQSNYHMFADLATNLINSTPNLSQYKNLIVASGSFPENLSPFTAGKVYQIPRYEWRIWEILGERINIQNIKYSDYGTKYPIYSDKGFQGTCSLKYSAKKDFIIYRGEKAQNHPEGNGQYILQAKELVNSNFYSGCQFSWGDQRIFEIANEDLKNRKRKPGSSTTWVEISQNHHITLMDSIL